MYASFFLSFSWRTGLSFFFSFSVLKTNRDIGVGNRIYLIDAVYDTSEFESASSKSSQRSKATRYAAINLFGSGRTALSGTSLFMYLLRTRQARSNWTLTCLHLCSSLDVSSRYLFLLPNDFASVKPWRWFRDAASLWDKDLLCQDDWRLSTTTNYLSYNVYAVIVCVRTLWRSIPAARGPMHDILVWLLFSPFISVPLLLFFHHPATMPFRLVQRCPANLCFCNCGGWSRNTFPHVRVLRPRSVLLCTPPELQYLTLLLHCYVPALLLYV